MPLEKCNAGGQPGFRWGKKGTCYTGPSAKKKALKQGFAEDPAHFEREVTRGGLASPVEVGAALDDFVNHGLADAEAPFANAYVEAVHATLTQKERDKLPASDYGWPEERKYPVPDQAHFDAAVKLLGRAPKGKQAAIKRRLVEIARRKGFTLPDGWKQARA